MTRVVLIVTAVVLLVGVRVAEAQERPAPTRRVSSDAPSVRNPAQLRAAQALASRQGGATRVWFEWDQVAGARAFVLSGQWTTQQSWAKQTRGLRVTASNAAAWTRERVAVEMQL